MKPLRINSPLHFFIIITTVLILPLITTNQFATANSFTATDELTDQGQITAVTVHRGWAVVTRTIQLNLQSPNLTLHIPNLPASLIPDSIHAQILGEPARSFIIKQYQQQLTTENENTAPQTTELRLVIQPVPQNNNQPQLPTFPLALTINIDYVVMNADWVPAYSLHAFPENNESILRSDILVGQNTGEDWVDTPLTVSSAKGHLPDWQSAFRMKKMGTSKNSSENASRRNNRRFFTDELFNSMIDTEPGNGSVFRTDRNPYDWSASPLIERTLNGKVTVPTGTLESHFKIDNESDDESDTQTTTSSSQTTPKMNKRIRFQLDEFRQNSNFRFVAIPAVSQEAFLVSTIHNPHEYHLLPGPAALFLNATYTGEMLLPDLAPEDELELAFGTDPHILVHRRELNRKNRKTGLLSDGRETQINYQLSLINKTQRSASVELWEQIPVSDSSDISITIDKESQSISKNQDYLDNQRPRGLLRWDINLPANTTQSNPAQITYTLSISYPKDVQPAWLPE